MQEWVKAMILLSTFHPELLTDLQLIARLGNNGCGFMGAPQDRALANTGLLCAPATGGLTQHMVPSCIWYRLGPMFASRQQVNPVWSVVSASCSPAGRHHRLHCLQANLWCMPLPCSRALIFPSTPCHP